MHAIESYPHKTRCGTSIVASGVNSTAASLSHRASTFVHNTAGITQQRIGALHPGLQY